ncbi:hypothetical protein HNQ77_000342 [Silvibacterium bohemicum]|uniref:DUF4352 domain-containing protein n=1 Tax=Silvibacterium bohemicum TaxID=1577686 RepID=A0A841JWM3_9BACT|nr:hypothetical protein [Silvibacterium bohemicum]MBB6142404.1 hypothetical protein [Silvibacterium bohemicum]
MADDSRSFNHPLLTVLAAFAIVSLAIGAYVLINQKPPVSAGQVLSLNVYPIHRDLSTPSSTNGLGGESEVYDEVLVFANVRITNQTDIPLFLQDMWAILDLPDGPQRNGAASLTDFNKVFVAYPDVRQYRKDPILRDLTLPAGQRVDGLMIFHFDIPKAQWDARQDMEIHVSFQHQNSLVITVPKRL